MRKMKFSRTQGVFVCNHVFDGERSVLLVIHHDDGDWDLMCGQEDHDDTDGHFVCLGHLLDRDLSIDDLFDLPCGWEAERLTSNVKWIRKIHISEDSDIDALLPNEGAAEFNPYIDDRSDYTRKCSCGGNHLIKIIQGVYFYADNDYVVFCAALVDHAEKSVWLAFITGSWPEIKENDCFVAIHVWPTLKGRTMKIEDGKQSPFLSEEVFGCVPISRDQVISVKGAKDWIVNMYLGLFDIDKEIGEFIGKTKKTQSGLD